MAFHITGCEQAVMFVYISMCVPIEVMVKVHVVDLKCETIAPPVSVRAYLNQTVTEFKQLIAQVQPPYVKCEMKYQAVCLQLPYLKD